MAKQDEKKVERAFEVIENLDRISKKGDSQAAVDHKKSAGRKATRAPAAVVFRISPGTSVFGSRIQAVSGG